MLEPKRLSAAASGCQAALALGPGVICSIGGCWQANHILPSLVSSDMIRIFLRSLLFILPLLLISLQSLSFPLQLL